MTIESDQGLKTASPRIPFLLRVLSIAILLEGLLGLIFFVLAGLFQMNADSFTRIIELNGLSSYFYSFYIILHIAVFSGLVLSGLLLLKWRRLGFYIFIFSYLTMAIANVYVNNTFGWTAIVVGFSFLTVLAYYYKKMK